MGWEGKAIVVKSFVLKISLLCVDDVDVSRWLRENALLCHGFASAQLHLAIPTSPMITFLHQTQTRRKAFFLSTSIYSKLATFVP